MRSCATGPKPPDLSGLEVSGSALNQVSRGCGKPSGGDQSPRNDTMTIFTKALLIFDQVPEMSSAVVWQDLILPWPQSQSADKLCLS
ncbi:hypothetical protein K470DRAFT_255189 [Piedraia hortae CBS 480.64]|uniref:Uncharacterized protein n=1 Tax=Piedraia hortae CBS 480.64 TaxID=1314780 RepID=A0A6A7C753_9PEZI|nr:hypothetical protein K470DRAFT_255189 [Piedraia hortae CBS 480.64]